MMASGSAQKATTWILPAQPTMVQQKVSFSYCGDDIQLAFPVTSSDDVSGVSAQLYVDNISAVCTSDDQSTLPEEITVPGLCCDAGICIQSSEEACRMIGGVWSAVLIPTVSEWGLAALALLIMSAGSVALFRRRTARA